MEKALSEQASQKRVFTALSKFEDYETMSSVRCRIGLERIRISRYCRCWVLFFISLVFANPGSSTNKDEEPLQHWIEALDSGDEKTIDDAKESLVQNREKAVPLLVEALKDEKRRKQAAYVLKYIALEAEEGMMAQALPSLISALDESDPEYRARAAKVLTYMGAEAAPAIEALRARMWDEDRQVRIQVRYALGYIGSKSAVAVNDLIETFGREDSGLVKLAAIDALIRLKDYSLAPLLEIAEASNPRMRYWAARTLGNEKFLSPKTVQALIKLLNDPDAQIRTKAAEGLGYLGQGAKGAISELKRHIDDPSPKVRSAVTNALKKIQK